MMQPGTQPVWDQEFESFTHSLTLNRAALQKILASTASQISSQLQPYMDSISKSKDKAADLRQKIEADRKNISNLHGDKSRLEKELQNLQQELEKTTFNVQNKTRERDGLMERLTEVERQLTDQEVKAKEMELKNQEMTSQCEMGLDLYRTHLGLDITRTSRSTLIFSFTQIYRSSPELPCLLELTLEQDQYRLLCSEPPLPNLAQIEDRLNATNNLAGCVAYVRATFQKMAK